MTRGCHVIKNAHEANFKGFELSKYFNLEITLLELKEWMEVVSISTYTTSVNV